MEVKLTRACTEEDFAQFKLINDEGIRVSKF